MGEGEGNRGLFTTIPKPSLSFHERQEDQSMFNLGGGLELRKEECLCPKKGIRQFVAFPRFYEFSEGKSLLFDMCSIQYNTNYTKLDRLYPASLPRIPRGKVPSESREGEKRLVIDSLLAPSLPAFLVV